jgi:hypothetical protein
VRIVLDPDATPVAKGQLCGQQAGFNLHGQTKVAANDKKGRENLCKYILRPLLASRVGSRPALPAANHRGKVWEPSQGFHVDDRLKILDDGDVRLEFKRPWSDGTSSVDIAPLALIARLAAIIPPPRRHVVRYSGIISSHSSLRSQVVPVPVVPTPEEDDKPSRPLSHHISWSQLLKRAPCARESPVRPQKPGQARSSVLRRRDRGRADEVRHGSLTLKKTDSIRLVMPGGTHETIR